MFLNPFRSLVQWTGRRRVCRPARRPRRARYHLILESLETRSLPSATTWTGLSSNPHTDNWSDARNWTNGVPGAGDTAIFTTTSGSHTALVDHAFTVAALTADANWGGTISVDNPLAITDGLSLASGTFGGGAAMSIAGTSRWTGGTISIGFRDQLVNNGTLTLANAATSPITLNGNGTLVNAATIVQAGATDLNLQSNFASLTTILNQGTYDFQSDTGISSNSGNGTFNNQGVLSKSVGRANASSNISVFLTSSSEIDVNAGVLRLASNGGVLNGGTFNVASGATLDLTGGTTVNYAGSFTGSGGGTVALSSGDLAVGSAGATFSFPAGLFQWSGGTLSIAYQAQLVNADTITLSNNATTLVTLNGNGTLVNTGTIVQAGAADLNLQSNFASLTTILNQGTYIFQTDTGISSNSGSGTFNNQGVLAKNAGRANDFSAVSVFLTSTSEIDVNVGVLKLASNGGVLNGGTFNVASGATLDLTGGQTVTYSGSFTGSGGGTLLLGSGDLAVDPVAGATFSFSTGLFQWTGGTITVPYQGQPLVNVGDMTLANGGLATLNGNGTLVNAGTIEQTGPGDLNFQSNFAASTTLLNQGVYDIQNDSGISSNSGSGTFNNQGVLSKSVGSPLASSTISVFLTSTSEIDVNAGVLKLASNGGVLNGGTFNVATGATLDLTGGTTVNYAGSFTGSGGGAVVLSGGDLVVDPNAGATFAFPTGLFRWTGGTITVSFQGQPLVNAGDMTLANGGLVTLNGNGTLVNAGTIEQTGPGDLNLQSNFANLTTLLNLAGAVYDFQADSGISSNSGNGTVINQGTMQKSGGTGTSTVSLPFTNSDTPDNPNSDLVLALSGRLSFTGSFTQTAGATDLAGGALGGGTLSILGGFLEGAGDVFANVVNGGVVSPGGDGAVGVLTIHGNYAQTTSGALDIDIGGPGAGTDYDQLIVTGTASLAGALNVTMINGFTPSPGQTFAIMTFASHSGNFNSITPGFSDAFSSDDHTLNLVAQ